MHVAAQVVSELAGTTITFPTDLISLVEPDGTALRAETFLTEGEANSRLEISAEGKVNTVIIVPVTGRVDLGSLKFRIAESGKEPATMPLSGREPKPAYPKKLTVPNDVKDATGSFEHIVRAQVLGATTDIDWGSARVDEGMRYVRVRARVTGTTNAVGGTNIFSEHVRLLVDGVARGPVTGGGVNIGVRSAESEDFEVTFVVPATTQSLRFMIGEPGETEASFDLEGFEG